MLARLVFGALLLTGACVTAAAPQRVYVVTWAGASQASAEQRALVAQADVQLREELRRRGALVGASDTRAAIVLTPSLEVFPTGLRLNLVGVRDRSLLGTISTRASGSTREAQLRAVVQRACREADQLQ